METLKRKVVVLDNNGETCDRYTIIFRDSAEMFGCSALPFHPQGVGMYCSNIATDIIKFKEPTKRQNKLAVNIYLNDSKHLGKRVKDLNTLPIDVQKYIKLFD